MIKYYRSRSLRQTIVGGLTIVALLILSLTGFAAEKHETDISKEKAILMGRVEHFFQNNFRDVAARKSVDWGELKIDEQGNKSVRYMYQALLWGKERKIMNQEFTFDQNGEFIGYENVPGYPKDMTSTKTDDPTGE